MAQDTKKDKAAKPAEEKAQAEAKAAEAKAQAESEAPTNAQDKPAEGQTADQTPSQNQKAEPPKKNAGAETSGLKPVSAWVNEKRLASWQSAALLRAKGWAEDKQVCEDEFNKALASTMSRTQGGGINGRRN